MIDHYKIGKLTKNGIFQVKFFSSFDLLLGVVSPRRVPRPRAVSDSRSDLVASDQYNPLTPQRPSDQSASKCIAKPPGFFSFFPPRTRTRTSKGGPRGPTPPLSCVSRGACFVPWFDQDVPL